MALELRQSPLVPRWIKVDEGKLRQILINLLANAIKFTDKGSVILKVKYLASPTINRKQFSPEKTRLHFLVADTGLGIDPQEIKRIFLPFTQTEAGIRTYQGTGLGLSISQKFVQLMGGEIKVRSRLGKGSLFYFSIPVQALDNQGATSSADANQPMHTSARDHRVLVVDDSEDSRLLLREILMLESFNVEEAENGAVAVDIWERWQPHLIFMDMRMPILDGYGATRHIKARQNGRKTVIIALTASAFEEEREKMLAAGCDDFLSKPFRQEQLTEIINKYLPPPALIKTSNSGIPFTLTKENIQHQLQQTPWEWRQQLANLALECDEEGLIKLLQSESSLPPSMVEKFSQLARQYQFATIFSWLENV